MSSLHWEARRRQHVQDRKQTIQQKTYGLSNEEIQENINQIAEELCTETALPTTFLLTKSKAAMSKKKSDEKEVHFEPVERTEEKTVKYSARIPNRYTSMNYIQQY